MPVQYTASSRGARSTHVTTCARCSNRAAQAGRASNATDQSVPHIGAHIGGPLGGPDTNSTAHPKRLPGYSCCLLGVFD